MNIFRVNDGSTWYFDAISMQDARAKWIVVCLDFWNENKIEPEIELVTFREAASIKIPDKIKLAPCSKCGAPDRECTAYTLLEAWQDNQKFSEKRAKNGALYNSKWP